MRVSLLLNERQGIDRRRPNHIKGLAAGQQVCDAMLRADAGEHHLAGLSGGLVRRVKARQGFIDCAGPERGHLQQDVGAGPCARKPWRSVTATPTRANRSPYSRRPNAGPSIIPKPPYPTMQD